MTTSHSRARTKTVLLKLSVEEKGLLMQQAEIHGSNASAMLRRLILGMPCPHREFSYRFTQNEVNGVALRPEVYRRFRAMVDREEF